METQKRQLFYILSLLTVLISCTQNDRNDNKQVSETVFAVNVDTLATHANNQNLVKLRSDSFVRSILDTNTLDWTFRPNDNNTPKYVKLFKQDGIKTIYAYSNKEYPQKSKASSYEHFVLFLLEYQDKASAVSAFDRFTSDTENFDIDKKQVNDSTYERISHIYFLSKYGGLVGRKNSGFALCGQFGSLANLSYF
jgi:hypothetical protein